MFFNFKPASLGAIIALAALPHVSYAEVRMSMDQVIAAIAASDSMGNVDFGDMDADGELEALVQITAGCEVEACPWVIVDQISPGSWGIVAEGYGANTSLVPTSTDQVVIQSDGVYFHWDGYTLSPWADMLQWVQSRTSTPDEVRKFRRMTNLDYKARDVQVYEADILGYDQMDKLMVFSPEGSSGEAGFAIIDHRGNLFHSSYSVGRPFIYLIQEDEGVVLRVVSKTESGMKIETFDPDLDKTETR